MADYVVRPEKRPSGVRYKVSRGAKTIANLGPHPGVPQAAAAWGVELARTKADLKREEDAILAADHAAEVHGGKRGKVYFQSQRQAGVLRKRIERLHHQLARLDGLPPITHKDAAAVEQPAAAPLDPPATAAERRDAAILMLRTAKATGMQAPSSPPPLRTHLLVGQLVGEIVREGMCVLIDWLGLDQERRGPRSAEKRRPTRRAGRGQTGVPDS